MFIHPNIFLATALHRLDSPIVSNHTFCIFFLSLSLPFIKQIYTRCWLHHETNHPYRMAADSDGDQQNNNSSSTLKAVVICEGNLHDPDFQTRLDCLVAKLTTLVEEPADNGQLKVDKVGCPLNQYQTGCCNCVRVCRLNHGTACVSLCPFPRKRLWSYASSLPRETVPFGLSEYCPCS